MKIKLLLTLLVLLATKNTYSQSTQEKNPFIVAWPATCHGMIKQALNQPELISVLEKAPISEDAVCSCVERRMRGDKYLSHLFDTDLTSIQEQMSRTEFKSYFIGKGTGYIMACTAPELERSTDIFYP